VSPEEQEQVAAKNAKRERTFAWMFEPLSARLDSPIWNNANPSRILFVLRQDQDSPSTGSGRTERTHQHTRPRLIGQLTAKSTIQSFMRSMRPRLPLPSFFDAVLKRCETNSARQTARDTAAHITRREPGAPGAYPHRRSFRLRARQSGQPLRSWTVDVR
jgi:hypothetical protein